ncbi:sugar ABC transporter substrate-binding protein [Nakamurella sp. DB0629]|uniref:Sugar ABC transporter substrate-binding protein n=2 Tax=Nakamurella aerolata TaxID=1656892 RepID=A0A849A0Q2_9ACTN|nr:sugar ABC transporter substrate-binding protein [Nakamurella aerolata]NNG34219.1 sugar ABC transporter substrate-binding protein [Nakamurella aerolata]
MLGSTAAALTLLAGCVSGSGSGSGGESPAPSSLAADQKVSLTFSTYAFQDATVKATEDIVASWNAANPNIQVTVQKVDPNSVHDKLVTQFAGKQAPDIIHDEAADIAGFSRQGNLADLSSLIPADLKQQVPQSVWDSVTYGGKITAVPTIAQVYTVFANTDLLKAAGVAVPTADAPWTWDAMHANANKLTKGGTSGFAWGLKSPTAGIMSTSLGFDGTFVTGDEAKPKISITDKELAVPSLLRKMLQDKSMAADSTSLSGTDTLKGFYAGKYAMVMAGNYVATQIQEEAPDGFNWTMLPLLKGTNQHQASNPQTLSVARQSKYPAQAAQFIAYYMQAKNLAAIAQGDSLIPVTKPAADLVAKNVGDANGWPAMLAAADQLVDAPWNKADQFPDWKENYATPAYQKFLAGEIDEAGLTKELTDGWKS